MSGSSPDQEVGVLAFTGISVSPRLIFLFFSYIIDNRASIMT